LLCAMTLAEKVGQTNQVRLDEEHLEALIAAGKVGSIICANSAFAGNVRQNPLQADEVNGLQRLAVEKSRLGIPLLVARDVIHGYRTVGPIPLGQAATWSPSLVRKMARVSAREAVADGIRWTFAPMVDIGRDARWGRVAEGFGEDPWLAARLGEAAVCGFQDAEGEGSAMAACAKHFAGYGAAEGGRDYHVAEISDYALWNVYLPTFIAAIRAGVLTIMSAFQSWNGLPAAANRELLAGILRDKLGFDGCVVTDWNAVGELVAHRIAETREHAAMLSMRAGVDMDMTAGAFDEWLPRLVETGVIPQARLDEAVARILAVKEHLGLFERPYADESASARLHLHPDHIATALEIAQKSVVLLENRQAILPLRKEGASYLLGGPLAAATKPLLGTWCLDGRPEDVVSPEAAIRAKLPASSRVSLASLKDDLLAQARRHDVAILFLGESDSRSGEANSIATLELPPGQAHCFASLKETGIPIIVVVFAGRPLDLRGLGGADAILYGWHPGISGGRCIADVIFGDVNPSGKLPITLPRSVGHLPQYYNYLSTGRPTDIDDRCSNRRYRDSLDGPLYPFGYGLSYTEFAFSHLAAQQDSIRLGETAQFSVEVRNTGERTGDVVVQWYVRDEFSAFARPLRELRGFERCTLAPGEMVQVFLELGSEELGYFSPRGEWLIEPGIFTIFCGEDSTTDLQIPIRLVR
jgi:beta-glucosidase